MTAVLQQPHDGPGTDASYLYSIMTGAGAYDLYSKATTFCPGQIASAHNYASDFRTTMRLGI